MEGRVVDEACQPVSDALLDLWQADTEGAYHEGEADAFRLRGQVRADADGRFAFRVRSVQVNGELVPVQGTVRVGDPVRRGDCHAAVPWPCAIVGVCAQNASAPSFSEIPLSSHRAHHSTGSLAG
jgi:hypothetical protein